MGQAIANQGAGNRLEVRVRGNANQLLEKYKQLARDAHQSGDRVAAEYYLQHADHYFRVLNDVRIRQEEMRARRGIFDPLDDEPEEDDGQESAEGQFDDGRREQRTDNREQRDFRENREPRDRGPRDSGPRDLGNRERGEPYSQDAQGREPRDNRRRYDDRRPRDRREEPVDREAPAAPALSDGEAALVAFGGVRAEPAPAVAVEGDGGGAEAPKRRRTRTRRTEPAPAEG
jgi:hypothetical protein